MTELIIHGPPQSSYLRSVRMACVEKGIEHELRPLEFGSDAHRSLHPYLKVPVMEHRGVRIFESNGIVHYLDRAFDSGIRLLPVDATGAALAEQWISVLNCYMYEHLVKQYAFAYLQAGKDGPDRGRVDAAFQKVSYDFDRLEEQLESTKFLAGDTLSHADILLAPAVQTATMCPEARAGLEARPKLSAWFAAISDRPSAKYLVPPPPG